ncbi:hypothetical protein HYS48_02540, partial [Candidatus Woesearchaeota archaeon]|nr:hypothetical protein [Candidatus Woesearchaeota archaeon]
VRGVIDPVAFIQQFQGRIPICHLGGQVTMLYEDGDITKIGSHMPITFGHDPNEFIANDALRREHNKIREEQLRRYITALHEAGCRQGVFEIHVGQEQRGKKWKFYYELSARNVRQILEKL